MSEPPVLSSESGHELGPSRRLPVRKLLAMGAALLVGLAWLRLGPVPEELLVARGLRSTQIVDRSGRPLFHALSDSGTRSLSLDPDRLPQRLVEATLAAEDARFFSHPGVDPLAIARAALRNLRAGAVKEGGSTLTQQIVKQSVGRSRSLLGKLDEAVLALRLEHRLSKREVLRAYLERMPYGHQLVGAEAAAGTYFGASADSLSPAQAAFLAGLPQRPSGFDPWSRFEAARQRQLEVIGRMERLGFLSGEQAREARDERLSLRRPVSETPAPHFVEMVRSVLPERVARVETTLDLELQQTVRGILEAHRQNLRAHGASAVAIAVLRNDGAEWLAWEGSGDYFDLEHSGAIDGVLAPRQPGSALKPFTYALAFERGFTPASALPDVPSHFATAEPGVLYSPRNYDGRFRGPMPAREALAGSENVPAVWLLSKLGVGDLLRLLRRAGLSTLDQSSDYYGYGLTMGDAEVRLSELVAAYSALARGGSYRQPCFLRSPQLSAARGGCGARDQVALVSPLAAHYVADILSDSEARAWSFGRGSSLELPFPASVKTGTSTSYRDNWTVGFTREVTVGVWVGNFDRRSLERSSGVTGAAPVFRDVMLAAQERVRGRMPLEEGEAVVPRPAELSPRALCPLSGLLAGPDCPGTRTEWLPAGSTPARCDWHRRSRGRVLVDWPSPYRSWAAEHGLLVDERALRAEPPPSREAARRDGRPGARAGSGSTAPTGLLPASPSGAAPAATLRILNPPPGARYLRDPTLRAAFQTLPLRAEAPAGSGELAWEIDGVAVGRAAAHAPVDWPLARGRHLAVARDATGREARAEFEVR